jgi:hypothetical protein
MPARNPRNVMSVPNPSDGRLSPWADAATGAPGWQITTASRRLAAAMATTVSGGTVHSRKKGEWQTRIPQPVLMVVVIGADADALRCHLSAQPHYGVFAQPGHREIGYPRCHSFWYSEIVVEHAPGLVASDGRVFVYPSMMLGQFYLQHPAGGIASRRVVADTNVGRGYRARRLAALHSDRLSRSAGGAGHAVKRRTACITIPLCAAAAHSAVTFSDRSGRLRAVPHGRQRADFDDRQQSVFTRRGQ